MEEKSLYLQTLEKLQSALEKFDTSFIVSNKLYRLALVSEIFDTACLFEQLYNAWSTQLPLGEGPDADVDFAFWKEYANWRGLVDCAQQNVCIDKSTFELGNGMVTDDLTIKRRKNYKKYLTAAFKHSGYPDAQNALTFFKLIENDKSGMLMFGSIVYNAVQTLVLILSKIHQLLSNPPSQLLGQYYLSQRSRFTEEYNKALQYIRTIVASNSPLQRKRNKLREYEDNLKDTLIDSGFLVELRDDFNKYDIIDYRKKIVCDGMTDEEVLDELAINNILTDYLDGNYTLLNEHLFKNRRSLSREAIQSFFVFVEVYPELQVHIGQLTSAQEYNNKDRQVQTSVVDAIQQQTAAIERQTEVLKATAKIPNMNDNNGIVAGGNLEAKISLTDDQAKILADKLSANGNKKLLE